MTCCSSASLPGLNDIIYGGKRCGGVGCVVNGGFTLNNRDLGDCVYVFMPDPIILNSSVAANLFCKISSFEQGGYKQE